MSVYLHYLVVSIVIFQLINQLLSFHSIRMRIDLMIYCIKLD